MTENLEKAGRAAAQEPEDESARLKTLVAELVEKNQALRFKVRTLERKARKTQTALEDASEVYRFLVP
jgi:hypothetical protein